MPIVKNIRITPKIMRLLALLEQGPKYGRQFAVIAPDLFFSNQVISAGGADYRSVPVANIYAILKRVEDAGLIEVLENFKPVEVALEDNVSAQRKYYTLTIKGKEALIEARKMLNPDER